MTSDYSDGFPIITETSEVVIRSYFKFLHVSTGFGSTGSWTIDIDNCNPGNLIIYTKQIEYYIFVDAACPSYSVYSDRCPDFNCLSKQFPGIVEKGTGLTDGVQKGSWTQVECADDYYNGNDGRTIPYKVTCGCNFSQGCRWVWKNDMIRQCLPKNECLGLDKVVWGGFVGNRIVGQNGVQLNARFYHQSSADGDRPDYSTGWTIFLLINHQVRSNIGNWTWSASSLEAELIGAHQESDCSSTVFQMQSTNFHGHDAFTKTRVHNKVNLLRKSIGVNYHIKVLYHEVKIDLRFLDMWELGDNVTMDTVAEYFDDAQLGWMNGHYADLTWCVAEHFSERPPYRTRLTSEYPEDNPMCRSMDTTRTSINNFY